MNVKKCFALLLGMALLLCLFTACGAHEVEDRVSVDFSSLEAKTLEGGSFTREDFSGKDVTVVNFWGTFCSPCIEEMPELAQLEKSLPDNVQFITVCLDGAEAPEDAKKILEEAGFQGVTLVSGNDSFQKACGKIQSVPTSVFVDKDGHMIGNGKPMGDVYDDSAPEGEMGVILGGGAGMKEVYVRAINKALKSLGKDTISLA